MTGSGRTESTVGSDALAQRGADLEIAIVGAGAVGATVAYDLTREGANVTLYDRGDVASGATGRAAGICYDAFAGGLDAAIASESIERFRALSGDDTFPFVECPYVWFARDGDTERADAIREQVRRMQDNGVVALEMDGDALADRFPALRTEDIEVAGVAGASGYADPTEYAVSLATTAADSGATLETETPVEVRVDPARVIRTDGDAREFDAVLVAAGARTANLLADAGVSLAMKPYRVQALVAGADFAEPMCYDATGGFYLRPHADGLLAGDGTENREADPDAYDRDADSTFATDLGERVAHRVPAIDDTGKRGFDRAWAGLCTATPDRDPLVGDVRDGLYVATGFQGHGFMRAPAIGRRLAEEMLGGAGIGAFDPTRFDGDEGFDVLEGLALDPN
ncbi:NAD(P)/FAD-dependent oxidoreductase [Natrinema halophilum]|uniref:FAD-binding oxidoreductase n=1 Tax=Natrinema halophilum TaxID=1699371 RepID=A0A7D5GMX3_9EURY|nr:FAD-dependent oxidoreductase [Natrinema halophilum]QLG50970.1 FAD-binding oxidoreductase [Natrinema halophilum]